jgi:hypothetical protein
MRFVRNHKQSFAWVAIGALLLGALVAALAPAVRAARGDFLVEVCTVAGSKWVVGHASVDSTSQLPGSGAGSGHHCPWCTLETPALELPDAAPGVRAALPRVVPALPSQRSASARPRAWVLLPAQAPPSFS